MEILFDCDEIQVYQGDCGDVLVEFWQVFGVQVWDQVQVCMYVQGGGCCQEQQFELQGMGYWCGVELVVEWQLQVGQLQVVDYLQQQGGDVDLFVDLFEGVDCLGIVVVQGVGEDVEGQDQVVVDLDCGIQQVQEQQCVYGSFFVWLLVLCEVWLIEVDWN